MLPPIPHPGRKVRFLLHALHAGWCPVTKSTHRHCGPYRSSIKDGYLVLFKGPFFLALGKTGATLLNRVKNPASRRFEFREIALFSYQLKFFPRNPFLVTHFGLGNKVFNLESPEMGIFEPPKGLTRVPFREIHAALTDYLVQTGVAPNRREFLDLVRAILGSQKKAYRAIRGGEGLFWKSCRVPIQEEKGAPPIRHYPILSQNTGLR